MTHIFFSPTTVCHDVSPSLFLGIMLVGVRIYLSCHVGPIFVGVQMPFLYVAIRYILQIGGGCGEVPRDGAPFIGEQRKIRIERASLFELTCPRYLQRYIESTVAIIIMTHRGRVFEGS